MPYNESDLSSRFLSWLVKAEGLGEAGCHRTRLHNKGGRRRLQDLLLVLPLPQSSSDIFGKHLKLKGPQMTQAITAKVQTRATYWS